MSDSFRTVGLYLPPDVVDVIDSFLYEEAGVVDVREYFGGKTGSVPSGDPLAESLNPVFWEIVGEFDSLYREANFDVAVETSAEDLELVTVAVDSDLVYAFRDKVEAARVLQECDTRSVHMAVFVAAVDAGYFDVESKV